MVNGYLVEDINLHGPRLQKAGSAALMTSSSSSHRLNESSLPCSLTAFSSMPTAYMGRTPPDMVARSARGMSHKERETLVRRPQLTSPKDSRQHGAICRGEVGAKTKRVPHTREGVTKVVPQCIEIDDSSPVPNGVAEDETSSTASAETKLGDYSLIGGEVLNKKYDVVEFLGRGTFGQVVKCWNREDGSWVAVKILKSHPSYARQGQVEVGILKMLNAYCSDQFNFVLSTECFEHKGHSCVVFEMLQLNLYDYLKQLKFSPMPLHHIRPILKQVAVALKKLKELGIIHADLKPENIMIVEHERLPFRIKVIDFGSALHSSKAVISTYLQSRYYRAPEVVLGLPFSEAIDMWSLGCVIAELFLGWPLFPGASEYSQIRYIVETVGMVPDHVLEQSTKAKRFFHRHGGQWSLMSTTLYENSTGQKCKEARKYLLRGLHSMSSVAMPDSMTSHELELEKLERREFIDLLQRMLQLDSTHRISPSDTLNHPFVACTHLSPVAHVNGYCELVDRALQAMAVCEQPTKSHVRCHVHVPRQSPPATPNPLTLASSVPTLSYRAGIDPIIQVQNMVLQRCAAGPVALDRPTHTCRNHVRAPLLHVPIISGLVRPNDQMTLRRGLDVAGAAQVVLPGPVPAVVGYQDLIMPMEVSTSMPDNMPSLTAVHQANEHIPPASDYHSPIAQSSSHVSSMATTVAANGMAVRRSLAEITRPEWGAPGSLWVHGPPHPGNAQSSSFPGMDYAMSPNEHHMLSQSQPTSADIWLAPARSRQAFEAEQSLPHLQSAHRTHIKPAFQSQQAGLSNQLFRTASNGSGERSPAESAHYVNTLYPNSNGMLSQSLNALPRLPHSDTSLRHMQLAKQLLTKQTSLTLSRQQQHSQQVSLSLEDCPPPVLQTADLLEQATSPAFSRFQVAPQQLESMHIASLSAVPSPASLSMSNIHSMVGQSSYPPHAVIVPAPPLTSALSLSPMHVSAPMSAPILSEQQVFVFPPNPTGTTGVPGVLGHAALPHTLPPGAAIYSPAADGVVRSPFYIPQNNYQ